MSIIDLSRVSREALERANERIIGAERLLLRASRVVELDEWRDDYDIWLSSRLDVPPAVTQAERAVLDAVERTFDGSEGLPTSFAAWRAVINAELARRAAASGTEKP